MQYCLASQNASSVELTVWLMLSTVWLLSRVIFSGEIDFKVPAQSSICKYDYLYRIEETSR